MRQAVRVGRQILLPRIRSQGKTGIQSVAAVSSTNVWAVGGQRLCTFLFKRFVEHWDGSAGVAELLTFLPTHGRPKPSGGRLGLRAPGYALHCPLPGLATRPRHTVA